MRRITWLVLLALTACTPHPRAIEYGDELCSHCHMPIVDPRFAGELLTSTGHVYPFDDVGCLAAFVATGPVQGARVHAILVNAFTTPDSMLPAADAIYLRTPALHTPMGSGLVALRPGREADSVRATLGGTLLTWTEVMASPPEARAP